MIHPGLLKLLRLRWRAALRRLKRSVKTPRGAILFLFGLAMFSLWIVPNIFLAMNAQHHPAPERMRLWVPLTMLVMALFTVATSVGEKALYFSPGEVAFLFAGPFRRRELLFYRLLSMLPGLLFSSLIFTIIIRPYVLSWVAAYVGLFFAMAFVQLLVTALMLLAEQIGQARFTRLRKTVLAGVAVLVALGVSQMIGRASELGLAELLTRLGESTAMHYLLLPLTPFGLAVTSSQLWPELAQWAAVICAMDIALLAVVTGMDAEFRETAVGISERLTSRIERARRTGLAPTAKPLKGLGRVRIPAFPWWGGAGPIARRQVINAVRNSGGLLMMVVALVVGFVLMLAARPNVSGSGMGFGISILVWIAIMLSVAIRFDFRVDLDHMEWLKMLPCRPWAVAAGQLFTPTVLTTLLLLIPITVAAGRWGRPAMALVAGAFLLPANLLLYATENATFLLYPSRVVHISPGDFQAFGRQLVTMLLKIAIVGGCALVALGLGSLAYYLTSHSRMAFASVAWLVLMGEAACFLPLVAWAFRRFDVSLHLPD